MIIAELDIVGMLALEAKAKPPLAVHRNSVLPRARPLKRMKPIARRHTQIIDGNSRIDHVQLPHGTCCNIGRYAPCDTVREQSFRPFVCE